MIITLHMNRKFLEQKVTKKQLTIFMGVPGTKEGATIIVNDLKRAKDCKPKAILMSKLNL